MKRPINVEKPEKPKVIQIRGSFSHCCYAPTNINAEDMTVLRSKRHSLPSDERCRTRSLKLIDAEAHCYGVRAAKSLEVQTLLDAPMLLVKTSGATSCIE